jgi:hypothetical protein
MRIQQQQRGNSCPSLMPKETKRLPWKPDVILHLSKCMLLLIFKPVYGVVMTDWSTWGSNDKYHGCHEAIYSIGHHKLLWHPLFRRRQSALYITDALVTTKWIFRRHCQEALGLNLTPSTADLSRRHHLHTFSQRNKVWMGKYLKKCCSYQQSEECFFKLFTKYIYFVGLSYDSLRSPKWRRWA